MIVGGYTLDLYCDGADCPIRKTFHVGTDAQYFAEHGTTCRKKARRAGWLLTRSRDGCGLAFCVDCKQDRAAVAARKKAKE